MKKTKKQAIILVIRENGLRCGGEYLRQKAEDQWREWLSDSYVDWVEHAASNPEHNCHEPAYWAWKFLNGNESEYNERRNSELYDYYAGLYGGDSVSYVYANSVRKHMQICNNRVYDLRTHCDVPGRNMIEPLPRGRSFSSLISK